MSVSDLLDRAICALAEAQTKAQEDGEQSLSFDQATKLEKALCLCEEIYEGLERVGPHDLAIADMVIAACQDP